MSATKPGTGPDVETQRASGSSAAELDQLFLLYSTGLQAGEAVARWWFTLRADAQDVTTEESLDKLLRGALHGIAHLLGADAVAVLVADDSGQLVARAAVGLQRETWQDVRIPFGAGMAGRVAATREPLVVPDLTKIDVVSETLRDSAVRSLVA
ncbi:MAG TPA: GAF domain-containing protein, partial [Acidimicrobiales bacterium]|nr:GAF domain-containing protein [Acidimicrobiales bacterium]